VPEERITVIDAGASAGNAALVSSASSGWLLLGSAFPELKPGFLLYVGGDEFRKNLVGAIDGYAQLAPAVRADHQLAVVCRLSDDRRRVLLGHAESMGLDPESIVFTDFVSDRELAALYRCCELFVFPSLYEGSGLPILEAMACGAPVAASNASSIPELLGDGEGTFNPADPTDIAVTLQGILTDPARLEALRERSERQVGIFTWERVAERTIEGYEKALAAPGWGRPKRRDRLAIFTPWPPEPSGIAAYNRRLVEKLADHVDVDVIVSGEEPYMGGANGEAPGTPAPGFDRSLAPGVKLWPAARLEWLFDVRDYDRVLYVLGNSEAHRYVLAAMREHPGVAVAHDVRLFSIYGALTKTEPAAVTEARVGEKLREMYGDRIPHQPRDLIYSPRAQVDYGVMMSQEMQEVADSVIVHSRHAAESLVLDRPPAAAATSITVLPLAVPDGPGVGRSSVGEGALIVCCGGVHEVKANDLIVEAFAKLLCRRPDDRLVFVGDGGGEYRRYLTDLCSELGLEGSVEFLGRVDDDRYWQTLGSADLAVQLRVWSNGEASAAVADSIAANVPTIVSDLGWYGELPAQIVEKVPAQCSRDELAQAMLAILESEERRESIGAAQKAYAEANSFDRVAERYLQVLGLR
jgi:glycosyltransferase involved in cell wall biosynthesis